MKLGKLPATFDKRDLMMVQYETKEPDKREAPIGFGHYNLISEWGMLGNDNHGDCVWAGGDHETMMWNAEAGVTVNFTPDNALADYAAVTGFDPQTGNNDNGTNMRDALNYRRQTGLIDASGNRHQIGAFVALEAGDWHQMLRALWLFDAVAIGVQFPSTAMDQFNAHKPWSYHKSATIEGGHYVPVVGRDHVSMIDVVTWGRVQPMTRSFYQHYCDEAYAVLSLEMLKDGKSLEGFDLTSLQSDLARL